MNKQEFLKALWMRLSDLPREDLEKSLDYYNEMIDDRIESGLSEEAAVLAVGSVEDAAKQILKDYPDHSSEDGTAADDMGDMEGNDRGNGFAEYSTTPGQADSYSYQNNVGQNGPYSGPRNGGYTDYNGQYGYRREKKSKPGWMIALLIIGFPVWFPLLMAGFAITISMFAVIWALIFAFYVTAGSLIVAGVAALFGLLVNALHGNIAVGLVCGGAGFFCLGLSIFMFSIGNAVIKCGVACTKGVAGLIKKIFRGKEGYR